MEQPAVSSSSTTDAIECRNFRLRLHFVRHGETHANHEGRVLGQSQSDLTPLGREQARLAGKALRHIDFIKVWSSDFKRARDTAKVMTNEWTHAPLICPDKLLRELAKGAREGRPVRMTYDEALAMHRREEALRGETIPVPLLESEEEVWQRFHTFLDEAFREAKCYIAHSPSSTVNALAVSHSASIRILLNRLAVTNAWAAEASDKRQQCTVDRARLIPNTSVTIVELEPSTNQDDMEESSPWVLRSVTLPDATHLREHEPPSSEDTAMAS